MMAETKSFSRFHRETIILVDTRERIPWRFTRPASERMTLPTGDYSIRAEGRDWQTEFVIERKASVSEFYTCCGRERARFERELVRLACIPRACVLCEFPYLELNRAPADSLMKPVSVLGSVWAWWIKYRVPFFFAGSRPEARGAFLKMAEKFYKYLLM